MKKLLMLFTLIPVSIFAQFFEGTITFNDDTTKKGFIYVPEYQEPSIKFRLEENGKTEKFKINFVKGFEIINDHNETVQYITLYLADITFLNTNRVTIENRKSWARIVKTKKITLCAIDKLYINITTFPLFLNPHTISFYCIKKQNQDSALKLDYTYSKHSFNKFKNAIQQYFEEDCPKLVDLIDREDFIENNGMERIVELYDQNCE